ncbi:putative ATP-grasp-modified RiPP [Streptosporangium sandarakinum]
MDISGRPWGLALSVPVLPADVVPYRVELDPVTQAGVYRDAMTGQIIEAGKHGTNKQTSKSQTTGGAGDGKGPQPSDQTKVTDYDTD